LDIRGGYGVSKANSGRQDNIGAGRKKSSKDVTSPIAAEKAKRGGQAPPEREEASQKAGEIPKFDLAEQIMAEQRKMAAVKRKGPGRKAEPAPRPRQAASIGHALKPPPVLSEQDQIIAEIVARDIEKLYLHNTSGL
jgi:hypothetical protein